MYLSLGYCIPVFSVSKKKKTENEDKIFYDSFYSTDLNIRSKSKAISWSSRKHTSWVLLCFVVKAPVITSTCGTCFSPHSLCTFNVYSSASLTLLPWHWAVPLGSCQTGRWVSWARSSIQLYDVKGTVMSGVTRRQVKQRLDIRLLSWVTSHLAMF